MIIGEIRRYLRDNNSIRISRSVRDLAYKALQAREELTKEKNEEPTVEEIAKQLYLLGFNLNFAPCVDGNVKVGLYLLRW